MGVYRGLRDERSMSRPAIRYGEQSRALLGKAGPAVEADACRLVNLPVILVAGRDRHVASARAASTWLTYTNE